MLWIYNDEAHGWGQALADVCKERGVEHKLFENPREPDKGTVFWHMHHHPQLRMHHKRAMEVMAVNRDLTLVPSSAAAELFDDKLAQARRFAKHMPRTQVFYTPAPAKRYLEHVKYPFVSKSLEGAGSHNMRIVRSVEDARAEVRAAFSDIGIKQRYSQKQMGYLLWQKLTDSDASMRVMRIGNQYMVVAVGAGNSLKPVREPGPVEIEALDWAEKFFNEHHLRWGAVDLTREKRTGTWYLLEFTVGWTLHNYYECAFIRHGVANRWQPTDRLGTGIWQTFVDEYNRGNFVT